MRFIPTFIIAILLCSVSIGVGIRVYESITSLKRTIYVDDDGGADYTNIQDAIDNASEGDIVYVYSGYYVDITPIYNTCVYINKSISLIGEDKNTTIIDGSVLYTVIGIMADNVVISGFTIKKSGRHIASPSPSGISVNPRSAGLLENIEVYNTIITNNNAGLRVFSSANCTFHNNIIKENKYGCSFGENEYNCSLNHNYILENEIGINLIYGVSCINNNNIINNNVGIGSFNSDSVISSNNFIDNKIHAWYIDDISLLEIFNIFQRNQWNGNYWDNWRLTLPKPIIGRTSIDMVLLIPPFNPLFIPLGIYPSIHFDWHPTREPYDIP